MKEEIRKLDEITMKYLIDVMLLDAKYSIQYYDYNENQWTAPRILRPERVIHLVDQSVCKIKFILG